MPANMQLLLAPDFRLRCNSGLSLEMFGRLLPRRLEGGLQLISPLTTQSASPSPTIPDLTSFYSRTNMLLRTRQPNSWTTSTTLEGPFSVLPLLGLLACLLGSPKNPIAWLPGEDSWILWTLLALLLLSCLHMAGCLPRPHLPGLLVQGRVLWNTEALFCLPLVVCTLALLRLHCCMVGCLLRPRLPGFPGEGCWDHEAFSLPSTCCTRPLLSHFAHVGCLLGPRLPGLTRGGVLRALRPCLPTHSATQLLLLLILHGSPSYLPMWQF